MWSSGITGGSVSVSMAILPAHSCLVLVSQLRWYNSGYYLNQTRSYSGLNQGTEAPLFCFFFDMDYFSTQLLTWLYKHLHWYHRGQNKGRNGGGCLNHCCGNKYSCNCTRGVPKINRQALRECYHLEPSARAKMNGIRNISE